MSDVGTAATAGPAGGEPPGLAKDSSATESQHGGAASGGSGGEQARSLPTDPWEAGISGNVPVRSVDIWERVRVAHAAQPGGGEANAAGGAGGASEASEGGYADVKSSVLGVGEIYPVWHVISGNQPLTESSARLMREMNERASLTPVGALAPEELPEGQTDGVTRAWQVATGNLPVSEESLSLWHDLSRGGAALSEPRDGTWVQLTDAFTRQPFYMNRFTGERRNELPTGDSDSSDDSDGNSLPGDWVRLVDPATGREYFFSEEREQTSWTLPIDLEADDNDDDLTDDDSEDELDGGVNDWEKKTDEADRTFWYSPSRQQSRWDLPGQKDDWIKMRDEATGRSYYYSPSRRRTEWTKPPPEAEKPVRVEPGAVSPRQLSEGEEEPPAPPSREAVARARSLRKTMSRKLSREEMVAAIASGDVLPPPKGAPPPEADRASSPRVVFRRGGSLRKLRRSESPRVARSAGGAGGSPRQRVSSNGSPLPAESPPPPPPATSGYNKRNPHRESASRPSVASLPPPSVSDVRIARERVEAGKVRERAEYRERSGYLYKRGGGRSFLGRQTWKRRWCVLKEGKLSYYKTEKDAQAGKPPLKNIYIDVSCYTVDPMRGSNDEFRLLPVPARTRAAEQAAKKVAEYNAPPFDRAFDFRLDDSADTSDKAEWLASLTPDEKTVARNERRASRTAQATSRAAASAAPGVASISEGGDD